MALIATDQYGNPFSITIDSTANDAVIVAPAPGQTPSTGPNDAPVKVLALIASALRLIGVLASGENPSIDESNDALVALNQMLDGWNADGLAVYTTRPDEFALVAGKGAYTYGPGGDFNTTRPPKIDSMSSILLDNPTNPIELTALSYTVDQWQTQIPVKNTSSSWPYIWYDTGDYPLRTINLWPVPNSSVNHVRFYVWQGLGLPASLASTMAFPPGYAEAFRFNLAVRLAPEYEKQPSPFVTSFAAESFARLKTMNATPATLQSDLTPSNAGWNYKATEFNIAY